MATVRLKTRRGFGRAWVAGKLLWAVVALAVLGADASAQQRPKHWLHAGAMPPGAIGRQRLLRGGPLSGFCQPVEVRVPQGARIAPAAGAGFADDRPDAVLVGLQIGGVYRFRVTNIPGEPGAEVFPTVEVIDRLHPPAGQQLRFPVPVELTRDELIMATEGKYITRVIYVENPQLALPIDENDDPGQRWMDAPPGEDPLVTADLLGRPIAIVRLGGRIPEQGEFAGAEPLVYERSEVGGQR